MGRAWPHVEHCRDSMDCLPGQEREISGTKTPVGWSSEESLRAAEHTGQPDWELGPPGKVVDPWKLEVKLATAKHFV